MPAMSSEYARTSGYPVATDLRHRCWRCARVGDVFTRADGRLLVVWRGRPRNVHGASRDADSVASKADLVGLGCGYCVGH